MRYEQGNQLDIDSPDTAIGLGKNVGNRFPSLISTLQG